MPFLKQHVKTNWMEFSSNFALRWSTWPEAKSSWGVHVVVLLVPFHAYTMPNPLPPWLGLGDPLNLGLNDQNGILRGSTGKILMPQPGKLATWGLRHRPRQGGRQVGAYQHYVCRPPLARAGAEPKILTSKEAGFFSQLIFSWKNREGGIFFLFF